MSLCQFLYESRRIKGKSLRKFIYDNSPKKYNVKGEPLYFDYAKKGREFLESNSDEPENSSDSILQDDTKLRQYRKRLLGERPVYQASTEWSAIRKVSEHEWESYFLLGEADEEVRDTEKRIRNLYKDLYKALETDIDENYNKKLDRASEKFCSKLKKIQYERYLKLVKFFLEHIGKDKTCYGINLYRLEKEMKFYRITTDVKRLVESESEAETECIVNQSILMDNILFPKLYEHFRSLPDTGLTKIYADTFRQFFDEVVRSSRLIIDKFVEVGVFGEDWEWIFLKTTNELAESVLYSPSEINYSLTPESQREFQLYLLEPVNRLIAYKKEQAVIDRIAQQHRGATPS